MKHEWLAATVSCVTGDVISTLSYHFEDVTCVVSHPFSVEVFSASLDQVRESECGSVYAFLR